ncbi:universal stress protein UspG [Thalassovita gelatinovora]|uniref:Universal stress protein UspG n=1 Tax=Thalassovita gelatinovora TaxID=53501 RepID=A0A0P1F5U5_THAGE|nr:universal stress protein [Thalassovita gelatinovora]QIZ80785.1 universal stress protein [Thalassovita gelatinovora]CUH63164.1 universal stress protein UspG [Thalassovita gelatinovora]SEQ62811.1 Nucleotide-binding universal stress protein, UspA family [Thalassovita gelatinovora]
MSKIIALVDGSDYSESVCHHVGWIAGRIGASVDLFHVLGRREGGNGDLSGNLRLGARSKIMSDLAELDAQRAKLAQAQGRAILEDAKALIEGDGVTGVTPHLRIGDIVETVTSQEQGADLIVVGKRGEAADFAKMHLGSNLERIVRAASTPVFVANRAFKPIEKVLIAFDGGISAMKAVDYVARDPLFAGLDCTVVTVGTPNESVRRGLDDAKATLAAGGHQAQVKVVEGQPDTALGNMVDTEGHDLLVMGAYGHSRIRTMIIGSTTTQMIRTCKVPVVLVK